MNWGRRLPGKPPICDYPIWKWQGAHKGTLEERLKDGDVGCTLRNAHITQGTTEPQRKEVPLRSQTRPLLPALLLSPIKVKGICKIDILISPRKQIGFLFSFSLSYFFLRWYLSVVPAGLELAM